MSRVFSHDFINNFGGQFIDEDLRFRMPDGASNLQCRLGIEKNEIQEDDSLIQ